eukprot:CAMPEP_0184304834 /NCGR_PEP_ID=MMETSP1049-20130417/14262_1 /TAXON_ID=77928 /ORGANISM="Proteomonas sulcata, Strain CCMP704" /LENGTH=46 /DNA_ID= /DNA_START= /DNA_END= /DNA_ORIENTATION=
MVANLWFGSGFKFSELPQDNEASSTTDPSRGAGGDLEAETLVQVLR